MSMGAIDWLDWKTDWLLVCKRLKHGTWVLHRLVPVDALQTLSSTFIYNIKIHCPLECSFETFAGLNNAECVFTSKTNATARRHFVCELSWRSQFTNRYRLNVSSSSFSLTRYRENMFKSYLVLYTFFFFYFWPSIKSCVLSLWTREKNLWTDVNSYLHLTNDSCMTSNETDQQTIDGSKTAKPQPTNHHNFYIPRTNLITTKLTNQNQDHRHKYHHLKTTLHLTLKLTTAQVLETSVTNNSLSKDYLHTDDHDKPITTKVSKRTEWSLRSFWQRKLASNNIDTKTK